MCTKHVCSCPTFIMGYVHLGLTANFRIQRLCLVNFIKKFDLVPAFLAFGTQVTIFMFQQRNYCFDLKRKYECAGLFFSSLFCSCWILPLISQALKSGLPLISQALNCGLVQNQMQINVVYVGILKEYSLVGNIWCAKKRITPLTFGFMKSTWWIKTSKIPKGCFFSKVLISNFCLSAKIIEK